MRRDVPPRLARTSRMREMLGAVAVRVSVEDELCLKSQICSFAKTKNIKVGLNVGCAA